ncbi:MAG: efflux RND transporter periplasmic adaptor subunit [Bosea sp. (in: a-proteobacteria)]
MKTTVVAASLIGSLSVLGLAGWWGVTGLAAFDVPATPVAGRLTLSAIEKAPQGALVDLQPTGSLQAGPPPSRRAAPGSPADVLRATIRAGQQVTLSAEISARIVKLPLREGDRFKAGDVLVAFDCVRLDAEFGAAKAFAAAHRNNLDNILYLERHQAAGWHSVRQTRLEHEKASQELKAIEARRTLCTVIAPFNGRIAEKLVYTHEIANQNQPLLRIVDESHVELQVLVPSRHLRDVTIGQIIRVDVDEAGKAYDARISQIAGAIDPVSQTVRIMAELVRPDADVLAGMSGTVTLSRTAGQHGDAK